MNNNTNPGEGGIKYIKSPKHKFKRDVLAVDHILDLCKTKQLSTASLSLQLGQSGFSFDGKPILVDTIDKQEMVRRDFFTRNANNVVDFMFYVHFLQEETVYFESPSSISGVTEQSLATVTRLGRFYMKMP